MRSRIILEGEDREGPPGNIKPAAPSEPPFLPGAVRTGRGLPSPRGERLGPPALWAASCPAGCVWSPLCAWGSPHSPLPNARHLPDGVLRAATALSPSHPGWYFSGAHSLAGASSLPDGRSLLLAVGCPLKVTNTFIDTPERGCRVPHLLSSVLCASGPALPCAARCGSAPPTTALWSWAS